MRDWTDTEVQVLVDICERLGASVRSIVGVMANESGCNPEAHNPGGAVGLIQFEPDTLRDLGWISGTDAFARLDVVAQLGYVERYYDDASRRPYVAISEAAPYVLAFLPALGPHAANPAYTLCALGGPLAWAYKANVDFDKPVDGRRKGRITVQDLSDAAEAAIAAHPVAQHILATASTLTPDANEV